MSYSTGYERVEFDEVDEALRVKRQRERGKIEGPAVGDFVIFADGTQRRISYVWPNGVQTSDLKGLFSGRYYLSTNGYASFSGGLHPITPTEALKPFEGGELWAGRFWFFHHDHAGAHRGVNCTVMVKVWECELPANGVRGEEHG